MTQDEIIEMAMKVGGTVMAVYSPDLEAFAKLVAARTLMNIDPSSFMSYQEGFEAGVVKEREACAKLCEQGEFMTFGCAAQAIRARGEA